MRQGGNCIVFLWKFANMKLTEKDIAQCLKRGMRAEDAEIQIRRLTEARQTVAVLRPALPGDGIRVPDEAEIASLLAAYGTLARGKKLVKFVPASGAATRMFKKWYATEQFAAEDWDQLAKRLPDYPFYPLLPEKLRQSGDIRGMLAYILSPDGLHYGQTPKGLLPFHRYAEGVRTAFEEHWVEAAAYAACSDGKIYLHFTVSPEHEAAFRALAETLKPRYEQLTGCRYELGFSCQLPLTDTVSMTESGELLRDADGNLVFRPGGHGSLLHNLNRLDADVVFIKNIDNVTLDNRKEDTCTYKKCLAAMLLQLQEDCFRTLRRLEEEPGAETAAEAEKLLKERLSACFPRDYAAYTTERRIRFCHAYLHRPMRVCGMVPREKEPGGGPFWIADGQGIQSLQIVETAEMDLSDATHQQALEASRYFNPVDLVCSLKDHRGNAYDLLRHVDGSRYFTAQKSAEGKNIKVLEHPGLWNGSMSDWITLFVAVPLTTFSPVKTVEDLLRPAHCSALNV